MATLSGSGGLFDFSSLFSNLGGTTGGFTLFGSTDATAGTGTGLFGGRTLDNSGLFGSSGTGTGLDFSSLFGTGTGFTLDFSSFGGFGTNSLFGSTGFGTGGTLDFSSLFGSGGTTFNFFS